MKAKFWLERWQSNRIGFHQAKHNKLLLEYWSALDLPNSARVFVPLCGKTLDMRWLAEQGHEVIGVELAELAVNAFFADETPQQDTVERFARYQSGLITILQGDYFDLTSSLLGDVDAVFDRGSLVALPPDMRFRYADHLLRIVPEQTQILLLTIEYEQTRVAGPPHAVHREEVDELFGARCEIELIESFVTEQVPPHFVEQGLTKAAESVYRLTKND